MAFSLEENQRQLLDPRATKGIRARCNGNTTPTSELVKRAAKASGYQAVAVKEVVVALFKVMEESLLNGDQILMGSLGILTPILMRARRVNTFDKANGGKCSPMIMPATFVVKYVPNDLLVKKMKAREVTSEDVEQIYSETRKK
jgi:nucleoid DNA-binding protein